MAGLGLPVVRDGSFQSSKLPSIDLSRDNVAAGTL